GVDVVAEDLLEVLRRDLVDRLNLHDAGVVGDDVEAAELFGRGVDCGEHLIALGDIGRDPDCSATESLDLLDHSASLPLLQPEDGNCVVESICCQFECNGTTDSLTGSCDEGCFVVSHGLSLPP